MADVARGLRRGVRWAVLETPWLAMWLVAWPVLALGRRAVAVEPRLVPFMPDLAQHELLAMSALRLELTTGQPSRNGYWHLGPMPWYWEAPFYAAAGRSPAGMQLAAAVAAALCLALIVLALDRMAGARGRWVAVAVGLAWLARVGLGGLASTWGPSLVILPFALCLVSFAAVVAGHRAFLPVAAVAGTFAAQAHFGSLPVVLAVAGAVLVVEIRRRRRGDPRPWRPSAVAAVLVLTVLWAPVAWDQVVGEHNATRIAGAVVLGHQHDTPYLFPVDRSERTLSPSDALGQVAVLVALVEPDASSWASFDLAREGEVEPGAASVATFVVLLAGAGVLGLLCRRIGANAPAALCGVAVVATVATIASLWRVPGEVFYYFTAHAVGIGLVLWLAVALAAVEVAGAALRARADVVRTVGLAAVGLVAAVVVAPQLGDLRGDEAPNTFFTDESRPGRVLADAVIGALGATPDRVVLDAPYPLGGALLAELEVGLLRRDVGVVLPRRWAVFGTPAQQRDATGAIELWVAEEGNDPPPGYELLVTEPPTEMVAVPMLVWLRGRSP